MITCISPALLSIGMSRIRRERRRPAGGWQQNSLLRDVGQEIHLIPEFGEDLLSAIRREELQDLLNRKALELSASPEKHLRWFLNAIFNLAMSDGLILNNPAAELRIPKKCQPGRPMRSLTDEEVRTYLEVFDLRERLIPRLAIFEGVRPGETSALRWKVVRKRRRSGAAREVAISDWTSELLMEWRDLAEDPSPEGSSSSEALVTPLSAYNLWRRTMQPKLEKVGLGWATFQVLRKTNASLSKKYGVDPKVASDQRGHGIGVSIDVHRFRSGAEARCGEQTRSRRFSKAAYS